MKKGMGVLLIGLALVLAIVPIFTDCQSQGRAITTDTGKTVPMKCHWTGIAEIGLAVPLALSGVLTITNKRKETFLSLGMLGAVFGALAVAFPTLLIGVCPNNAMICNMIMKPTLIAAGTLSFVASAVIFASALRMHSEMEAQPQKVGAAA